MRPCPLCLGQGKELIHRQEFAPVEGLLGGYTVVRCTRCSFCFADNIPEQAVFDRYYREMSKYAGEDSDYDRERFSVIAEFVQKDSLYAGMVLDVGCGSGGLIEALLVAGYENVYGVDPSLECAKAADARGMVVFSGGFGSLPVGDWDTVILSGVLEHVVDLHGAVESLPGCDVIAVVPDASRYDAEDDGPFQEFSPEHINFFGQDSLARLFEAHGYKSSRCERAVVAFSPGTLTPIILAKFRRTTAHVLKAYVSDCKAADEKVAKKLADLPLAIVWGAGAHTRRLIASGALPIDKIAAIVDSNPVYWGLELAGRKICSPEQVMVMPDPILVSSRVRQQEIVAQIKKTLPNPIITLYDEVRP